MVLDSIFSSGYKDLFTEREEQIYLEFKSLSPLA